MQAGPVAVDHALHVGDLDPRGGRIPFRGQREIERRGVGCRDEEVIRPDLGEAVIDQRARVAADRSQDEGTGAAGRIVDDQDAVQDPQPLREAAGDSPVRRVPATHSSPTMPGTASFASGTFGSAGARCSDGTASAFSCPVSAPALPR